MLIGHAHVVDLFRRKYQSKHGGEIGIALCGTWPFPYDDDEESERKIDMNLIRLDVRAAKEHWEFNYGK
jgi:hypothetical protein